MSEEMPGLTPAPEQPTTGSFELNNAALGSSMAKLGDLGSSRPISFSAIMLMAPGWGEPSYPFTPEGGTITTADMTPTILAHAYLLQGIIGATDDISFFEELKRQLDAMYASKALDFYKNLKQQADKLVMPNWAISQPQRDAHKAFLADLENAETVEGTMGTTKVGRFLRWGGRDAEVFTPTSGKPIYFEAGMAPYTKVGIMRSRVPYKPGADILRSNRSGKVDGPDTLRIFPRQTSQVPAK